MNDTLKELQAAEIEMRSLEQQATAHEQAAREARNRRADLKQLCAELRAIINDAAIVAHTQGAAKAAEDARAAAVAANRESTEILERLREKEARMDALLAGTDAPPPEKTK